MYCKEVLKPLQSGEVRGVTGVLGDHGQIPIRIRCLENEERRLVSTKWFTPIPSDYPYELVLVDIPDPFGYFAFEEDVISIVKERYPQDLATPAENSLITIPCDVDEYPVTADATGLCLRHHKDVAKLPKRGHEKHEQRNMVDTYQHGNLV